MLYGVSRWVLLASVVGMMVACGSPHARVNVLPPAQIDFTHMQLGEVAVFSREEQAQTNHLLQQKLRGWRTLAQEELASAAQRCGTTFVEDPRAHVLTLRSEVRYGNRTKRWLTSGIGGKGAVRSELVVSDPVRRETLFEASAESALAVGFAGGDVDEMFRRNIAELLAKYEQAMRQR
jgi:hypothetical protein